MVTHFHSIISTYQSKSCTKSWASVPGLASKMLQSASMSHDMDWEPDSVASAQLHNISSRPKQLEPHESPTELMEVEFCLSSRSNIQSDKMESATDATLDPIWKSVIGHASPDLLPDATRTNVVAKDVSATHPSSAQVASIPCQDTFAYLYSDRRRQNIHYKARDTYDSKRDNVQSLSKLAAEEQTKLLQKNSSTTSYLQSRCTLSLDKKVDDSTTLPRNTWVPKTKPAYPDSYIGPGPVHEVTDSLGGINVKMSGMMDEPRQRNRDSYQGGGFRGHQGGGGRKRMRRGLFTLWIYESTNIQCRR
jgi:hypothetical protein